MIISLYNFYDVLNFIFFLGFGLFILGGFIKVFLLENGQFNFTRLCKCVILFAYCLLFYSISRYYLHRTGNFFSKHRTFFRNKSIA